MRCTRRSFGNGPSLSAVIMSFRCLAGLGQPPSLPTLGVVEPERRAAPHLAAPCRSGMARRGSAARSVKEDCRLRVCLCVCVPACVRAHVALAAPVLIKPAPSPRALQFVSTKPELHRNQQAPRAQSEGLHRNFSQSRRGGRVLPLSTLFCPPFSACCQQMEQMSIST